jgi:hypothetical protein
LIKLTCIIIGRKGRGRKNKMEKHREEQLPNSMSLYIGLLLRERLDRSGSFERH